MGNKVSELDAIEAITDNDLTALENIELILAQEEEKNHEPSPEREGILIDAVAIRENEPCAVLDEPTVIKSKTITERKKPSSALKSKYGNTIYDLMKLEVSDDHLSEYELRRTVDDRLREIDDLAKKVGEKAINIIHFAAGNSILSSYTKIAMKLLKEKGEVTRMEIRQAYLDFPYKVGTANAQASQMMKLMPALNIANREGTTLIANPESKLLPIL